MFSSNLLVEYTRRHLLVEIDVIEGPPREYIRMGCEGGLDVAFLTGVHGASRCRHWPNQIFRIWLMLQPIEGSKVFARRTRGLLS